MLKILSVYQCSKNPPLYYRTKKKKKKKKKKINKKKQKTLYECINSTESIVILLERSLVSGGKTTHEHKLELVL